MYNIMMIFNWIYCLIGKTKNNDNEGGPLQSAELPIHDLQTVMAATANFSDVNKLGQGGFGIVYKVIGT
jgi:hypothetical protein